MRTFGVLAIGVLAATVGSAGPGSGSVAHAATRPARGPDLSGVTLTVGVVSATSSASQDVRLASGAFTKTPYGLEWATFPTSTGALEALNADALDLAVDIQATAPLFAQANAKTPWTRRNAPIRLIAAAEPPPGGLGIFVRTGSGIRSMADLKGRKVAYSRGSNSQYYWAVAAEQARLRGGSIEEVQLATAEARPAFLSGAVDALVTDRRIMLNDLSTGKVEALADGDPDVPVYTLTVANTDALRDRRKSAAVGEFLARLATSKRWLPKHQAEAAAIYVSAARMTPENAAAAVRELPVEQRVLDRSVVADLQDQLSVFFAAGVVNTDPKVAVVVDRRFDGDVTR